MRSVKFFCPVLLVLLSFSVARAADDKADALATVKAYDNAFNTGDVKTANGLCTADAIIIDDFPPHAWQGANTCQTWLNGLTDYNKQVGITDEKVIIGAPWRVSVAGDRAYIVVPATYTHKTKGKPVVESGATWTLALQKTSAGWRISGWAWAQHWVK
jgi:ketosteroid isomerase-like protein